MTLGLAGLLVLTLVGVDQLVKYLVALYLPMGETVPILNGVLHITHVENTGAGFSLFAGQTWLLVYLTAAILLALAALVLFKKIRTPFLVYAVSAVIAGGAGNLIDRLFRGAVIDFIDVRLIHFAVFNFADCCVVVGCILIFAYTLFADKPNAREETEDAADD